MKVTVLLAATPADVHAAATVGAMPLALDTASLMACTAASVEYTTIDDWLDPDRRATVLDSTGRWAESWSEPLSKELRTAELIWPRLDAPAMWHFWWEWALQWELADVFLERGVRWLRFPMLSGSRPSIGFADADIFGHCWPARLKESISLDPYPVKAPSALAALARRAVAKGVRRARAVAAGPPAALPKPGSTLFAIPDSETLRFAEPVSAVARARPGSVGVVLLQSDQSLARLRARDLGVPVQPAPRGRSSESPFGDVVARLRVRAAEKAVRLALRTRPAHFDWYARDRWPALAGTYAEWRVLLRQSQPGALVTSSINMAHWQLPALAARDLGIPTVALPHGAIDGILAGEVPAEVIACANHLQEQTYVHHGVPPALLRRVRGVMPSEEYRVRSKRQHLTQRPPLTIVALTNPVSFGGRHRALADAFVGHREQLTALEALKRAAHAAGARLLVKAHPGFPDLGLVEIAGLSSSVLPLDTPFDEAMAVADVVVGVNYLGSALAHVISAGKPLLHFWTARLLRERHPCSSLFQGVGLILADSRALNEELSRLSLDQHRRRGLGVASTRAATILLDETAGVTLDELLGELSGSK